MTAGFDIAIIGGGIIGLSLGRKLAREGVRVAVVDAGDIIPPATIAAAGMLAPSFEVGHGSTSAIDEEIYAFGAASLERWPDFAAHLEEESGVEIDWRHDGILGVALNDGQAAALQRDAAFLNARGGDIEMLDSDEARRLEPGLSHNVIAALHAPRDAQVDPRLALAALQRAFERAGGVLISARVVGTKVMSGSGFILALSNGERTEAAQLVAASGAASMGLVEGARAQPIRPVKGEAVALAMPTPLLHRVVRAPGAYLCPKSDGRLVIGATEYEGRDDLTVDHDAAAELQRSGARAAKDVKVLAQIESWAGLRPGTPDAAPILGVDPQGFENLFYALGHYRNGVLLAPASADALGDLILGRESQLDISPFTPDRF